MHPAFSVIFFTTASGAGYGLLALIGIGAPFGLLPADRGFGIMTLALALGLITLGLLSSSAHLGRPERAWRAFSQWRTSWLSREGVLSLATYVPSAFFALGWLFFGRLDGLYVLAAAAMVVLAIVTVYCTAMIYASLKPIHAWRNTWVPRVYLILALMSGALWLNALVLLWGASAPWLTVVALLAIALGAWLKERYWTFIDTTYGPATAESATGLGARGSVSFLDGPHTEANYLLREMGYRIARKHSIKLRRIALALGFALPLVLTLLSAVIAGPLAAFAALFAALSAMLGILVERWLFFAEAKHTVTLYYGASAA
jgi:sulfite dehydrogenase (quinone) subunit SoeC